MKSNTQNAKIEAVNEKTLVEYWAVYEIMVITVKYAGDYILKPA